MAECLRRTGVDGRLTKVYEAAGPGLTGSAALLCWGCTTVYRLTREGGGAYSRSGSAELFARVAQLSVRRLGAGLTASALRSNGQKGIRKRLVRHLRRSIARLVYRVWSLILATVKKGILVSAGEWWKHLRKRKAHRPFWKRQRIAEKREIRDEVRERDADRH